MNDPKPSVVSAHPGVLDVADLPGGHAHDAAEDRTLLADEQGRERGAEEHGHVRLVDAFRVRDRDGDGLAARAT